MNKVLLKLPIDQRYDYIRKTYNRVNQNVEKCAQILEISKNTVYHAIRKSTPTPRIYEKKLKEEHKTYIYIRTMQDPHISGEKLSHELNDIFDLSVSDRTINKFRVEDGLKYRPPIRSVYISPQAAKKRYDFTIYHLENQTDFSNVVFSDESWFALGRNSTWVWIDKKNITDKVMQKKVAHSPQVMIWEGIGYDYKTDLVIVEGTVNSESYIDQMIFGSNLIETADDHFGIGKWLFMQDKVATNVYGCAKSDRYFEE